MLAGFRLCVRPQPFPYRQAMSTISLRGTRSVHCARLPSVSTSICLTELEDRLCSLLDDFTQELRKESQNVECRIAGGWVRDKARIIRIKYDLFLDL